MLELDLEAEAEALRQRLRGYRRSHVGHARRQLGPRVVAELTQRWWFLVWTEHSRWWNGRPGPDAARGQEP